MSALVQGLVHRLRLGDPVCDAGLSVIPVFGEPVGASTFITLEEALASDVLTVTEVSESGSVPNLKVRNHGSAGVLILDGEELAGAKQNRVLNTTVYIRPGQEIVIPVSCTEAGRWRYDSPEFADSGYVAAPAIRFAAAESVTQSVRQGGGFLSDQGRVWDEVSQLQERHAVASPTCAARDVYEHAAAEVRRRGSGFRCLPGQIGILVLWSGRVAGLDVVADDTVFARLHGRLVRSYALDAPPVGSAPAASDLRVAADWLAALAQVQATEHESPGSGVSYRFTGRSMVGAALAVDGAVLHLSAFATPAPGSDESRYPGFYESRAQFPW